MPAEDPAPTRGQLALRRRRRRGATAAGLVVALLLVGWALVALGDDAAPPAAPAVATSAAPPTTLPLACAEALAHADELAEAAGPLANAGIGHAALMERLELYLDHKPGGLSGKQVYDLGAGQMRVMDEQAPDARVHAKRYQEVRKRCPIR